jgi:UDPglucose--hexose-1-phosphate uridylyltransferase
MPDFRFDPISARWVAIASNRLARPMEFVPLGETLTSDLVCPFCKGNESETPTQLEVWGHDGQRVETDDPNFDWSTRVVPNKFPAFPSDAPLDPYDTKDLSDLIQDFGPYNQSRLPGVQELIIPTPRHVSSFGELTKTEAMICWAASQTRLRFMKEKEGIEHAMLFMNCRSAAGASLAHAHLQLIGSPVLTHAMKDSISRRQEFAIEHRQTLMQSVIAWERKKKQRVLIETEDFMVVCPFASRTAYQIWIIPKNSIHDFTEVDRKVRDELALLTRKLIRRLDRVLDGPPYNLMLHEAPFEMAEHNHWYVEIMPRLTRPAGLEWGTDIWINPVSPEDAAMRLRR